ncbi:hypothetical protein TOPH_01807, partial [Tolypocladium ophioglossoides CBS 100239]
MVRVWRGLPRTCSHVASQLGLCLGQHEAAVRHVVLVPLGPPQPLRQHLLATLPRRQGGALVAVARHAAPLAVGGGIAGRVALPLDGEARRPAQRHGGPLVALARRVRLQLGVVEHGRAAGVGAVEDGLPLAARAARED